MALKFIDIGANLTDPMFRGVYNGIRKHPDDLQHVLDRAWKLGMQKMIITVGTLKEADEALKIAKLDSRLYITMGCHPTRCDEFSSNPDEYYTGLRDKIANHRDKVVAIGECGLDYDRLQFCEKSVQLPYFERQLDLAEEFKLPLFLHCRSAHADFVDILQRNREKLLSCGGGVVHSFTGTSEEAQELLDLNLNLYIGINGCSLKTEDNLNVVRQLPSDRLMLETDCPWCGVRPSHASSSFVKIKFPTVKKKDKWSEESLIDGRNEPCQIIQVLEAVAGVQQESPDKLAEVFYQNTLDFFFKHEH